MHISLDFVTHNTRRLTRRANEYQHTRCSKVFLHSSCEGYS